jgi:hypothetical protein
MLSRLVSSVILFSAFLVLTAMGGSGGGGFERAPKVEKNFSATVTDLAGNAIKAEKFSWEGRLMFSGYQGMAQVSIPFEKVKALTFGDKRERKVKVAVRLSDGTDAAFEIDAASRLYGETNFGSFMLRADEVKNVTFP